MLALGQLAEEIAVLESQLAAAELAHRERQADMVKQRNRARMIKVRRDPVAASMPCHPPPSLRRRWYVHPYHQHHTHRVATRFVCGLVGVGVVVWVMDGGCVGLGGGKV